MLIEMAQQLHERFHALPYAELALGKGVADKAPEEILWRDLAKTISRMQIRELSGLLLEVLAKAPKPYVIFLDAMEAVTPTQKAVMIAMFEKAQLIGATIEKRTSKNLARLWWSFKTLEVPPLDDTARLQIVERFIDARHLLIENPHMFRKHVVKASGGNPQALADLLSDANKERLIKKNYIREEMKHEGGEHYFDLTPLALLGICCIMASRFMARGMESTDIYLLASTTSAFLLLARVLLARGAAKN